MSESISKKRKFWSILCYLNIIILLPLIKKQDDDFVNYHIKQGVVLIFFFIPVGVIFRIIIQITSLRIGLIYYAIVLLYMIIGIWNCSRGKMKALPFIGKMANKITL
jgi:uncharacterized membrane protein